jgi:hypothetical protein
VSRDHGALLQRLDFIERGDPLASLLRTCLGQQLMNAIVGGVSGDHQSDGWHIQDGRVVRVGVPDFDHDQIVSFELDDIAAELLGKSPLAREFAPEAARASTISIPRVTAPSSC